MKTIFHKGRIEVCLPGSRLLSGLYGMWSSLKIPLDVTTIWNFNAMGISKLKRIFNEKTFNSKSRSLNTTYYLFLGFFWCDALSHRMNICRYAKLLGRAISNSASNKICQYSDPMRDRLLLAFSQSVKTQGAKDIAPISADSLSDIYI